MIFLTKTRLMNILFVCTYNRHRSLTAEHLFKNYKDIFARSAGTSLVAEEKLLQKMLYGQTASL